MKLRKKRRIRCVECDTVGLVEPDLMGSICPKEDYECDWPENEDLGIVFLDETGNEVEVDDEAA